MGHARKSVNMKRLKTAKNGGPAFRMNQKKRKKFFQNPSKPLAQEKGFMYNSNVVCLGMKW